LFSVVEKRLSEWAGRCKCRAFKGMAEARGLPIAKGFSRHLPSEVPDRERLLAVHQFDALGRASARFPIPAGDPSSAVLRASSELLKKETLGGALGLVRGRWPRIFQTTSSNWG